MSARAREQGFTITELMVTLFVAALFAISGWQLYAVVTQRSIEAQRTSEASNIGYKILRQSSVYSASAPLCTSPATHVVTPAPAIPTNTLPSPVSVEVKRCIPVSGLGINRFTVTISYGVGTDAQEVSHAMYSSGA